MWLFQSQLFGEQHLSLSSRCPAEHLEQPGDFTMTGTATHNADKVTYNLTLTWNDVIDPNHSYSNDTILANLLQTFYSPKDYEVHLSWDAKYQIIYKKN